MDYPAAPHSHVVPAGYLRAWAHGQRIAMRLVNSDEVVTAGLRDVGVRKNFYRRQRPGTGETIYDVEWSLQQAENVAIPIVATLAPRWPLNNEDKGKLAQFLALQFVRGPAFKAWHDDFHQATIDALLDDPVGSTIAAAGRAPEEVAAQAIEHIRSDSFRLIKMLEIVRSVGTAFGSMHWTLVSRPGFDGGFEARMMSWREEMLRRPWHDRRGIPRS